LFSTKKQALFLADFQLAEVLEVKYTSFIKYIRNSPWRPSANMPNLVEMGGTVFELYKEKKTKKHTHTHRIVFTFIVTS
jgi:hypothetical protein